MFVVHMRSCSALIYIIISKNGRQRYKNMVPFLALDRCSLWREKMWKFLSGMGYNSFIYVTLCGSTCCVSSWTTGRQPVSLWSSSQAVRESKLQCLEHLLFPAFTHLGDCRVVPLMFSHYSVTSSVQWFFTLS